MSKGIAHWGGFTVEQIVKQALDHGGETWITCPDEAHKKAVLTCLRGKHGAPRVDVMTLDEYEARTRAAFDKIARTCVTPETTSFSNYEEDVLPKAARSTAKLRDESTTVKPRRGKRVVNPAFAPKRRAKE